MKKIFASILFVLALTTATTLTSCHSSNTPSAVVEQAMGCLQTQNFDSYVELFYYGEEIMNDQPKLDGAKRMYSNVLKAQSDGMFADKDGLKNFEIVEEKIAEDGKSAMVKVKINYGNGASKDSQMSLKKSKDGRWLLEPKRP